MSGNFGRLLKIFQLFAAFKLTLTCTKRDDADAPLHSIDSGSFSSMHFLLRLLFIYIKVDIPIAYRERFLFVHFL